MLNFYVWLATALNGTMDNQTLNAQLDKRIITLWLNSLEELHRNALQPCQIVLDTYKVKNTLGVLLLYNTVRIECCSEALRNALMIGYRHYAAKAYALGYDVCFSVNGEWSVAYSGATIQKGE